MALTVRNIDNRTVELLTDGGRVLARVEGSELHLELHPAQPDVEDVDVRGITDPDVRLVADRLNEVLRALRGARILAEPAMFVGEGGE